MKISTNIFDIMNQYTDRKWRIDGDLVYPNFNDVDDLIKHMVEDFRKMTYDSIESGGILMKKDGNKIDVYVHMGEINEADNSI